MSRLTRTAVTALAALLLPLAAGATASADDLLVLDAVSGATARIAMPEHFTAPCWGPRGLETMVERPGRRGKDATRRIVAYAPGRKPRVLRRAGRGEEVIGALQAPGCAAVAEVHYAFADRPEPTGGVLVRDAAGRERFRVEATGQPEEVSAVWSHDGSRLAILRYEPGRGATVRVLDGATGAPLGTYRPPAAVIDDFAGFTADKGTLVLSTIARTGPTLHALDLATGAVRTLVAADSGRVYRGAVPSPTANVVAALNDGGGIELLDPARGFGPTLPTAGLRPDGALAWSPDGTRIAYATEEGRDGTRAGVAIVDARPGARPRRVLRAGRRPIADLTWSPDGRSGAVVRTDPIR